MAVKREACDAFRDQFFCILANLVSAYKTGGPMNAHECAPWMPPTVFATWRLCVRYFCTGIPSI